MDAEYLGLRSLISAQKPVASEVSFEILNEYEAPGAENKKVMVVGLVREAIEKILLPEVQDDTHSKTENQVSGQLEQVPFPGDSASGGLKGLGRVFSRGTEKGALNHWSNMKKWILLQRFIKELDKVRELDFRSSQVKSSNIEFEAEKSTQRAPALGGRKSAEEWMLDYALRQAIGQLPPAEKNKVALLVKAFETVVPPQENSNLGTRITPGINHLTRDGTEDSVSSESSVGAQCSSDELKEVNLKAAVEDTNRVVNSLKFELNSSKDDVNVEPGSAHSGNLVVSSTTQGSNLVVKDTSKLSGIEEDLSAPGDLNTEKSTLGSTSQTERTSHIKMWHTIYQYVVSSVAEKAGSGLIDGSETEEVENKSTSSVTKTEVLEPSNAVTGLTKEEIVKLVKDTVNEILLSREESFRAQSTKDELVPGQPTSGQSETTVDARPEPKKPRNWSKLKNLMLIKRSIRTLEVARELKKEADPEADKVKVKSQMVNERMKAKQWMMDYAVQHIVTKLTPARKRRVSMLIEAFEAVVPFPEM